MTTVEVQAKLAQLAQQAEQLQAQLNFTCGAKAAYEEVLKALAPADPPADVT